MRYQPENGQELCEAVRLARDLIRIESTNPGAGEGKVEAYIRDYLSGCGALVQTQEVLPLRSNVIATIAGACKSPMLVFSCHMDTVVFGKDWSLDPLGGQMKEGRLYGRGACDMKSGLACALTVFKKTALAVQSGRIRLKYPLRLLCSVDEEGQMRGITHALRQDMVGEKDWVLDLEPTDGEIQMAHKGRLWLEIKVHGITAHASRPEQGADAVAAAAETIHEIRSAFQTFSRHEKLGRSTVTFGQIQGGYQPYVVPDECRIWADLRLTPPTDDRQALKAVDQAVQTAMKQIPGVRIEYQIPGNRPYVEINEQSVLLGHLQKAVCEVTGQNLEAGVFPGYTDSAVVSGLLGNRECMSYGPGDLKYAHKPDEFVEMKDIERCERVLEALISRMLKAV